MSVALTSTDQIAASGILPGSPNLDSSNANNIASKITIEDGYQKLVNGFGSKVASMQRLAMNQQAMSNQVDSSREQLAGVSLDEESINMVMAQRSYEAAARVLTTVDSILDTLINRTGLVR
jgi:flagellar hook-associated protein 1 FlgK